MKPNNPNQPEKLTLPTPNTFTMARGRLLSFNTPQLSPMRMVQSPFMNLGEGSIFDNQLNLYGDFRLEQGAHVEENVEPVNESSDQSISEMQFPKFAIDMKVTKENLIQFLVDSININEERIMKVKESFEQSGQVFLSEVLQYLYKRFKKTKKTKQEMIKYTMRKSFKYITDQMKKEDPSLIPLLSTDGLEGMSIYFTKHSQDNQISIPFKKNSLEKTMNTAFLKKVFSVYRFYKDYKKFLKSFQNDFLKDNKKKIASMTESMKQCLNTKNYKSLENYKRLPWTKQILMKLKQFAYDLLNYSPITKDGNLKLQMEGKSENGDSKNNYKMQLFQNEGCKNGPKRSIDSLNYDDTYKDLINNNEFVDNDVKEEEELLEQISNPKKMKKKSVIILTPPILPMTSPKLPDMNLILQ